MYVSIYVYLVLWVFGDAVEEPRHGRSRRVVSLQTNHEKKPFSERNMNRLSEIGTNISKLELPRT